MAKSPRRRRTPQTPELTDAGAELAQAGREQPTRDVTLFYSPTYWAEATEFDTFRKAYWIERRLTGQTGKGRDFVRLEEPDDLHDVELNAVHTAAYLQAVETGEPPALATSNGLAWTPGLYAAAACSSQGIAQAAVRALQTGGVTGSLSAGLHHARADRGFGFCTFNGLALAARAALEAKAAAILILDLDAHFGGGTWSLVSDWDTVWHADVSVSDVDGYNPKGHPRSVVERVTSSTHYLDTIQRVLDGLSATTFDLLIYNAGMDPFERCAVGGLRGITKAMLDLREQLVFDWARTRGIPVAFTLAGGYTGAMLSRDDLVGLHLLTLDAANPARLALAPPQRLRESCPLGDSWRGWDSLSLPRRELPLKAPHFNAAVVPGPAAEPLNVTWERSPHDASYRPPTNEEGGGVDWRFEHGSPSHAHAEFEVEGHRVHLDCVRGTKYGPGRSWTEIVAFVDGACVGHGWTGGTSLGFGGTKNLPLSVPVTATTTILVDETLRVVIRRRVS